MQYTKILHWEATWPLRCMQCNKTAAGPLPCTTQTQFFILFSLFVIVTQPRGVADDLFVTLKILHHRCTSLIKRKKRKRSLLRWLCYKAGFEKASDRKYNTKCHNKGLRIKANLARQFGSFKFWLSFSKRFLRPFTRRIHEINPTGFGKHSLGRAR